MIKGLRKHVSEFILYNAPQSTCSQRVRFVLNAKSLAKYFLTFAPRTEFAFSAAEERGHSRVPKACQSGLRVGRVNDSS